MQHPERTGPAQYPVFEEFFGLRYVQGLGLSYGLRRTEHECKKQEKKSHREDDL